MEVVPELDVRSPAEGRNQSGGQKKVLPPSKHASAVSSNIIAIVRFCRGVVRIRDHHCLRLYCRRAMIVIKNTPVCSSVFTIDVSDYY